MPAPRLPQLGKKKDPFGRDFSTRPKLRPPYLSGNGLLSAVALGAIAGREAASSGAGL